MPPCLPSNSSSVCSAPSFSSSLGEGLGPEVEVPLVAAAGVEVDAAHRAQRVGVPRRHPHRVELQPPLPDLVHQAPGGDLEGQERLAGAIGVGREAGRAAVVHQRGAEAVHVEAVGLGEALEEHLVGALELVAELAGGLAKAGEIGALEQRVPGVRGERAEDVGPHHRHHHRAVAPGGLAGDAAVVAVGRGRVAVVDEAHHLVAQVVLVAAGPGGVQVLGAAVRGPGVDEDDDRIRAFAGGEHGVHPLEDVRLEGLATPPGVELAEVPLDHVDARQRPRVIVLDAGRAVDVERAPRRVPERVGGEQLRVDEQPVERPGQGTLPGRARRAVDLLQRQLSLPRRRGTTTPWGRSRSRCGRAWSPGTPPGPRGRARAQGRTA